MAHGESAGRRGHPVLHALLQNQPRQGRWGSHRALVSSRRPLPQFTYVCIKYLLAILESDEEFARAMISHRQDWEWMDSWLKVCGGRSPVRPDDPMHRAGLRGAASRAAPAAEHGADTPEVPDPGGEARLPTLGRRA
jgi:hypothetical protein